ncbi:hypothetical protein ACVJMY_003594 [Bradyrhizobium diazoefficiens]
MVVEKDLEAALDQVRVDAAGPVAGVFGPSSVTWRIDREAVIFLGAGRALLLQLAHPWVAAAIAEHSRTLTDPIGRFHRTFDIVFAMVFGSLDRALLSSRQLYRRHSMIVGEMPETVGPFAAGSRYCANDIPSLRWVHATLVETGLMAHDLVLPQLSVEERERYWTEGRLFGALFGLTGDDLPADWSGFAAYTAAMVQSETLTVSPAGARDRDTNLHRRPSLVAATALVSRADGKPAAGAIACRLRVRTGRARYQIRRQCGEMDQARLSEIAGQAALCRSLPGSAGEAARRVAAGLDNPLPQPRLDRTAADGRARQGVKASVLTLSS